jgi:hypothetical protein
MPNGVCMVRAGLLEKPLEVVRRWPRSMLVDACGGCGAPHAGFARVPVAGVIMTGHGYSPLKTLLAPLIAAFLGVVSGDVGRCPLIAARCRLPASWWRAKHDYLIAGGALDGGTA